ncbi:hypothetical protein PVAP13_3KG414527 [Panicum virgatum]|uniref:Uncharacterized protein n=1 Tax=Panicum virgatum TaxID=38727 RepID=A0A8T0V306_PANVG|nr:hypothetical protein PVAP13_3KG414527 [Panicum virgatum]
MAATVTMRPHALPEAQGQAQQQQRDAPLLQHSPARPPPPFLLAARRRHRHRSFSPPQAPRICAAIAAVPLFLHCAARQQRERGRMLACLFYSCRWPSHATGLGRRHRLQPAAGRGVPCAPPCPLPRQMARATREGCSP